MEGKDELQQRVIADSAREEELRQHREKEEERREEERLQREREEERRRRQEQDRQQSDQPKTLSLISCYGASTHAATNAVAADCCSIQQFDYVCSSTPPRRPAHLT